MKGLAAIWGWLKRSFSNILSVVGLVATFYFALVYVPDYVEESNFNKREIAREELVHELGQRFYQRRPVTLGDVNNLINAKEAFYSLDESMTARSVLLLVENDFSKNDYLSLETKQRISSEIAAILPKRQVRTESEISIWWYVLGGLVAVGVLIAAIASIRYRTTKEAEFEAELDDATSDPEPISAVSVSSSIREFPEGSSGGRMAEYSRLVAEAAKESGFQTLDEHFSVPGDLNLGPEFVIRAEGVEAIVLTRAFTSKVGLNTMRGFLYHVRQTGKPGILFATSHLTIRAREALEVHKNRFGSGSVKFVHALTKGDAAAALKSYRTSGTF